MGNTTPSSEQNFGRKLVEEFTADLEESLILAIAGERDLETDYDEIREILSSLAGSARSEAATGFDPSGLGCFAELEGLAFDDITNSGNGMSGVESLEATENATTVSDPSESSEVLAFTSQTNLGESDKIESLRLIFPNFADHTIKFILKQTKGDLELAFDQLLDRQFLEENNDLPKGVDIFYNSDDDKRPKKGKGHPSRAKSTGGRKKVALDYTVVSPTSNDEELEGAKGPVQLPSSRKLGSSRLAIPPATSSYVNNDSGWQVASKKPSPIRPSPPPISAGSAAASPVMGARSSHLRAAAELSRTGPLARQAASVYLERARHETRRSMGLVSAMAERHVDGQSTADKIDLHGVTVLDGVRIAKHRVWRWWELLGENREAKAKHGFTVVTGVGYHCANGVSRLRQAVGAALKNDGWKVHVGTGEFHIVGRS